MFMRVNSKCAHQVRPPSELHPNRPGPVLPVLRTIGGPGVRLLGPHSNERFRSGRSASWDVRSDDSADEQAGDRDGEEEGVKRLGVIEKARDAAGCDDKSD